MEPDDVITLKELEREVVESGLYHLWSFSITSGCRHDAAIMVLAHARDLGGDWFDRAEMTTKKEQAYRHFEYGEPLPFNEPSFDSVKGD